MVQKLNKTVFVGVSGGVDSSVSAAILKDQGYDVVGVFIRTWTPDFIECTWRSERRDAMRVCAHLGIPFLECDAEDAYKKGVADYMIEEYKKGNTPNPDVMCNREVKFGVFWQFAKSRGADFIATGHYAQIAPPPASPQITGEGKNFSLRHYYGEGSGMRRIKKGNDISKDQSYFLWTLTQEDLSHTLFPIGHLEKSEVRKLAKKYNLLTAVKKDSQGVCFLGPLDMKDFLSYYIESKHGDVLDEEGNIIGYHDGAVFFTLGERHGFTITKHTTEDMPLYVVGKDIEKNIIVVSTKQVVENSYRVGAPVERVKRKNFPLACEVELKNTNWILARQNIGGSVFPEENKKPASPSQGGYTAQIRYHGEQIPCRVDIKNNETFVIFENQILVSPGQSIVVYDGDVCLGGGVVV